MTALSAIPLSLPLRRDDAAPWQTGGIGLVGALALVMLLLVFVAWFLRRSGWKQRGGRMQPKIEGAARSPLAATWRQLVGPHASVKDLQVGESVRLTPRSSVHVVHWDGREWLLGCAEGSVTVLGQKQGPQAQASQPSGVSEGAEAPRQA